jgi:hypothetical protein
MKRTLCFELLGPTLLAALLLASLSPVAEARSCSTAKTAGEYGFTLTGVVNLPTGAIPIAAVGRVTLDSNGNVSGTEARSAGGGFADETFTGTYVVNADCTGTTTLQFFESGQLVRTSVLSIVFDNNEREIRMVQKSLTLPNGTNLPVIITVEARRTFYEEDD